MPVSPSRGAFDKNRGGGKIFLLSLVRISLVLFDAKDYSNALALADRITLDPKTF